MTIQDVLGKAARWHLERGDCRELLRCLPDASVDACVTDPPYEIGFMGKKWDASGVAYDVGVWREVLRLLKPGGHLLAFGGTRTSHRMVCAIEDAGFEVRDSIVWLYGSGFPKSLNVSKAIDTADGLKDQRAVVSTYTAGGNAGVSTADKGGTFGVGVGTAPPVELAITRGASEKSRAWDGWGTALKPAQEPVCVARKPLSGTVAANVLQHGTGAINIDATRLPYVSQEDRAAAAAAAAQRSVHTSHGAGVGEFGLHGERAAGSLGPYIEKQSLGRWPANVALSHSDACQRVGSRNVKAAPSWNDNRPPSSFTGAETSRVHHSNADGTETVDAWRCAPGCPVAELDRQSGVLRNGGQNTTSNRKSVSVAHGEYSNHEPTAWAGDTGGASRFFYCAKSGAREREAGCEDLPTRTAGQLVDREEGSPGTRSPRAGAGRISTGRRNHHPTVKPVSLMQWLCRMVTPYGGIVLDPFLGSGTTGCAAVSCGFRFIGFDLDSDKDGNPLGYIDIARARITHWERQALSRQPYLLDVNK